MKKFLLSGSMLLIVTAVIIFSQYSLSDPNVMKVYKTETCGCCNDWIDHIEAAGFKVESTNLAQLHTKKIELGIPAILASCHTAVIDGYVIEGHVPASDIQKLLNLKPDVTGLTVPGMPHGSPGMETGRVDSFDVLTFEKGSDKTRIWASYP
ncbi:DUF411 domain-containing protein [Nitrincola schmidtii]|uniref:DUF411 domain-containing protein n=1 Tax=Nitrincola schmidtii TaxID=1730894 RepID=UPI0019817E5C